MDYFNDRQLELMGVKPGYKAAITRAKSALKNLQEHGVGLFASGAISFRAAKALDPRFELDRIVCGINNDGGDGGDELPEYDDLAQEVADAEEEDEDPDDSPLITLEEGRKNA